MPETFVRKADGTLQPLDWNKIRKALRRSGAGGNLCDEVIESMQGEITPNISTNKIYRLAFLHLKRLRPGAAARLGLKSSLFRLGPDGYPFETFVGALLKGRGYETKLRQIIPGRCITHEVDVVATRPAMEGKKATKSIVECKFHNSPHLKCPIQSALYTWARFLDVREADDSIDSVWLATNTKFSGDVIQYADCVGLKLLGWSFPSSESIQVRIEENQLYPITILPKLDRKTFAQLHGANIILLKELVACEERELESLGIKRHRAEKIREQAQVILSRKE
ncbi:MAG: hypothetical protein V1822_01415 [Candidatus Micrarchaeota archaeon]